MCNVCGDVTEWDQTRHEESSAATCTKQAYCNICNSYFGKTKPHNWKTVTADDTKHSVICNDCSKTETAAHESDAPVPRQGRAIPARSPTRIRTITQASLRMSIRNPPMRVFTRRRKSAQDARNQQAKSSPRSTPKQKRRPAPLRPTARSARATTAIPTRKPMPSSITTRRRRPALKKAGRHTTPASAATTRPIRSSRRWGMTR